MESNTIDARAQSFGYVVLLAITTAISGFLFGFYIAAISPSKNRGTLVSMNQLAIVSGILAAYLVHWQLSKMGEASWRWMLADAAIPAVAFFAGLLAIPESPRWLISRGRYGEGQRILARIFGAKAAEEQVRSVQKAAAGEEGSWHEVFSPAMRKRLGVGMALALFSQVTGINTVLYYGSIIISEHFPGQSTGMALASNVIIGAVNLIFTIVAMVFLDRWGRRAILMTASGGMGLALTLLVIGLHVH